MNEAKSELSQTLFGPETYGQPEPALEPADVIEGILSTWKPGHFNARELAEHAMLAVGINPPYVDISLEALAADLIEHDDR